MSEITLKSCPFCGGDAMIQHKTNKNIVTYWVLCKACFNRTNDPFREPEEAANPDYKE